ncbi:MAG: toxin-antitoxin system HicB family antitoxin [Burkholderiaceae bacterium]|nr:toxin-antitoxin system HicB family antitoxin [Burkholderiaceae bacterium]
MTVTLRIPESLKAEAAAYAASLGLSLNNLVAVALREYLDARPAPKAAAAAPLRVALPATPRAAAEPGGADVASGTAKGSPADRLRAKAQVKRAAGSAS